MFLTRNNLDRQLALIGNNELQVKSHFQSVAMLVFYKHPLFLSCCHAQNKAKKCTTQNCVTIKEYEEQNEQLKKETNELKNKIADLNYKIAENKESIYDSAIQTQSTWLSVYGILFLLSGGVATFFGFKKLDEIENELDGKIVSKVNLEQDAIIERLFDSRVQEIMDKIESLEKKIQEEKSSILIEKNPSDRNAFE